MKFASLVVGFGTLTFLGALNDGFTGNMKQNFILTLTGHVQIHARGFEHSQQIQQHISDPDAVIRVVNTMPEVLAWTVRVRTSGLASVAEASTAVQIVGVDIAREARLTRLTRSVTHGTWLPPGDARALVLGKTVAENLGVGLGDKVILTAQTPAGEIVSDLFRLRGVLEVGARELDRTLALVPLTVAQDMLGLGSGVTDVVIRATDHEGTDGLWTRVQAALAGGGYEVLRWTDLNPVLRQQLALNDTFSYFVLLIVVMVVAAETLNVMLMAIQERGREFGLMEALGTRKGQIFAMIVWESMLLVMSGCVAGYAVGTLATLYVGRTGVDVSRFSGAFAIVYLDPVLRPLLTWQTTARIIGMTFVAVLLASLYPAWRATRREPVEALRCL